MEGVFYPKGTKVPGGTPNAAGSNLVRVHGKGLQYLNRVEARRKSRSHPATKKNYEFQHETNGFSHTIVEPGKGRTHRKAQQQRPPTVSNHTAHRERQIMREVKRSNDD